MPSKLNEDVVERLFEMLAIGRRAIARAEERMIEQEWAVALTEFDLAIESVEQIVAQVINAAPSRAQTEHEHEVETRGGMPMD